VSTSLSALGKRVETLAKNQKDIEERVFDYKKYEQDSINFFINRANLLRKIQNKIP